MYKNNFFESFGTKTEFYAKFRDENNNLSKKKNKKQIWTVTKLLTVQIIDLCCMHVQMQSHGVLPNSSFFLVLNCGVVDFLSRGYCLLVEYCTFE